MDATRSNCVVLIRSKIRSSAGKRTCRVCGLMTGRAYLRLYRAQWNGKPIPARAAPSGTVQITLPRNSGRGRLQVEPA